MWNKFIVILLVGLLAFSLSAQQYRNYRRNRGRSGQPATVQQKKTAKKTSAQTVASTTEKTPAAKNKFDPKKPLLTQKQIDSGMNEIRQRLLECKIRDKMADRKDGDEEEPPEDEEKKEDAKKSKKDTFISRLDLSIMLSRYKSLIDNFELTEVSRIRPEWYQKFRTELDNFGPIINEMTIAMRTESNGRYVAAVKKFKAQQEACLKFLKEKPPRISKEQYEALVLKNTKIRQQNYLKKLKEEREAAMKRRQEMLKQLQQKNQQKNQPQKKDQGTADTK